MQRYHKVGSFIPLRVTFLSSRKSKLISTLDSDMMCEILMVSSMYVIPNTALSFASILLSRPLSITPSVAL